MILPKNFGHYLRVGLATFWTCIAAWETFHNGFLQLETLLWLAAAVIMTLAVVVEGVRIRRRQDH